MLSCEFVFIKVEVGGSQVHNIGVVHFPKKTEVQLGLIIGFTLAGALVVVVCVITLFCYRHREGIRRGARSVVRRHHSGRPNTVTARETYYPPSRGQSGTRSRDRSREMGRDNSGYEMHSRGRERAPNEHDRIINEYDRGYLPPTAPW